MHEINCRVHYADVVKNIMWAKIVIYVLNGEIKIMFTYCTYAIKYVLSTYIVGKFSIPSKKYVLFCP